MKFIKYCNLVSKEYLKRYNWNILYMIIKNNCREINLVLLENKIRLYVIVLEWIYLNMYIGSFIL